MAILGGVLDLNNTLSGLLGGTGTGNTATGALPLGPITNLVGKLTGGITGSGTGSGTGIGTALPLSGLLDLEMLEDGLVSMTVGGEKLIVLPKNGGIISYGLLDDAGLGGVTNGLTGILEIGDLMSETGLLNLTGVLGNGVLDLDGLLGDLLKLLSLDGLLNPGDHVDPGGEVDPDSFAHTLYGTAGNDTFLVPNGSTYIDGKEGRDTVTFAQSAEGISVAVGKNAVVFSREDTLYYFKDVERVEFTEGTLYLDTGDGENAGMAYRLYQAAFDRLPDAPGLTYWINRLDTGSVSLAAIADSFIHSPEFVRTFGTVETVSNARFVELLYLHTLDRGADSDGYSYWVSRLDANKTTRADLLAYFSESEENQAQVAPLIDNGIWIA